MQEKQEPVTDTYLEDYEEFMDDDDERWHPASRSIAGVRNRIGQPHRRKGTRI